MSVEYPLQLSSVSPNHAALYEESLKNPESFWGDLGRRRLRWFKEFDQVMNCDMSKGEFSWFIGGEINVSGRPRTCMHGQHSGRCIVGAEDLTTKYCVGQFLHLIMVCWCPELLSTTVAYSIYTVQEIAECLQQKSEI